MKSVKTVNEYILTAKYGNDILVVLRDILKSTELTETIKWGAPTYTLNGKNVVGIGAFKSYVGLWFFQGALLKDNAKVLINAQEGTTKALRQWRFQSVNDINEKLIIGYINEAIQNQKNNREVKIDRNKPLLIPDELKELLNSDLMLNSAFNRFTKSKQREFADYIREAKQEKTKLNRLKKIVPLIQQNVGLNDKYRK